MPTKNIFQAVKPLNDTLELRQKAQRKVMDLLAKREHTELELRQKLESFFKDLEFSAELVEQTLRYAREKNWLEDPEVQAQKVAQGLHQKQKGIHYINNYLNQKGLPSVTTNDDLELEKALELVKNKYPEEYRTSGPNQAKLARTLASRGFDSEIIRKVIHEEF